jgi:hypothetical protein
MITRRWLAVITRDKSMPSEQITTERLKKSWQMNETVDK